MSETYNYEEGAIHNDHKKVLHIETVGSNDIGKLISAFFADDAEEAEVGVIDGQVPLKHVEKETVTPNDASQEPNYFAPQKNLSVFLCQDWFDQVSTNKNKYTKKWREGLMEALLASQYRDEIALLWTEPEKRLQLKCTIVGIMKDAGIIKGSYNALAPRLGIDEVESASLAKYMGYGKKQAFYDWLIERLKQ